MKDMINPISVESMVERFLSWRLPKTFAPDGGIKFTRTYNGYVDGQFATDIERKPEDSSWPTGTNLFSVEETKQMIAYMLKEE